MSIGRSVGLRLQQLFQRVLADQLLRLRQQRLGLVGEGGGLGLAQQRSDFSQLTGGRRARRIGGRRLPTRGYLRDGQHRQQGRQAERERKIFDALDAERPGSVEAKFVAFGIGHGDEAVLEGRVRLDPIELAATQVDQSLALRFQRRHALVTG